MAISLRLYFVERRYVLKAGLCVLGLVLSGCAAKPPHVAATKLVMTNNVLLNMSEEHYKKEVRAMRAAGMSVHKQGVSIRMILPSLVFFNLSGNQLKPSAESALQRVAKIVRYAPTAKVNIVGYTGDNYTIANARRFSARTASEVKRYLVSAGISARRLHVVAAGRRNPIAGQGSFAGQTVNQRVEVVVNPR